MKPPHIRGSGARVAQIIGWIRGPDVLDLGCSEETGPQPDSPYWLHGQIRRRFPDAWGLDLSEQHIETMRTKGHSNLFVGDAQSFFLEKRFDTIVAGELIEHLESPGAMLQSCARHLKTGGRVVLSTPYAFGLNHVLYATWRFPDTCSNPQHVAWYCPVTLAHLADRAGLRVLHWETIEDFGVSTESRRVRVWYFMVRALGRMLPRAARATTLLFVLEPKAG